MSSCIIVFELVTGDADSVLRHIELATTPVRTLRCGSHSRTGLPRTAAEAHPARSGTNDLMRPCLYPVPGAEDTSITQHARRVGCAAQSRRAKTCLFGRVRPVRGDSTRFALPSRIRPGESGAIVVQQWRQYSCFSQ
eukprot:1901510-Pleurochrysis_carterae.AAC.2